MKDKNIIITMLFVTASLFLVAFYYKIIWLKMLIIITFPMGIILLVFFAIQSSIIYKNKKNIDNIIPIYKPYKNFNPLITGYLIDFKLNQRDIVSGFLWLVQKKILSMSYVEENEKEDIVFVLNKKIENIPDDFDLYFVDILFEHGRKEISLKKDSFYIASKIKFISKYVLSFLLIENILEKNFYKGPAYKIFFIGIFSVIISGIFDWELILLAIGLSLVVVGAGTFFQYDIVFSSKAWDAKKSLMGFKIFLNMAEKERFDFFYKPDNKPTDFVKYFPYAVAFGVEKKWVKEFEGMTSINFYFLESILVK